MYEIKSENVIKVITGYSRTFRLRLKLHNGKIIGGDNIGETEIEHIMCEGDAITIGQVISKRTELKLYGDISIRKNDIFQLYIYIADAASSGQAIEKLTHSELEKYTHQEIEDEIFSEKEEALDNEYIPIGEFIVAKVTHNSGETTVIAYDRLKSDKQFDSDFSDTISSSELIDMILSQLGVTERIIPEAGPIITSKGDILHANNGEIIYAAEEYNFSVSRDMIPENVSCRELLGYIAAVSGRNAVLTRDGAFTTVFISDSRSVLDINKIDAPSFADSDVSIAGMRVKRGNKSDLIIGNTASPYTIQFNCPFMTAERLTFIWRNIIKPLVWRPTEMYERIADPRRELGDMLLLDGNVIPITSHIFHFDGGLSADISACGQIED